MRHFLLLLLVPALALAADPLPDGAELRLGSPPRYDVDSSSAVSPDGTKLATHPQNSGLHVWDMQSGKLLYTLNRFTSPSVFTWTAGGKLRGLFQGYECLLLHEWADDTATGPDEKTLAELRHDPNPLGKRPYLRSKALSPDGRRVAFLHELNDKDRELRLFTPKPGVVCRHTEPDFSLQLPGGEWVGFSGDGNTLFVAQRQKVTAYDLSAKTPSEPAWVLDLPPEEQKFIEQDGKKIAVQGKGWPQAVQSADGKRVAIEFSHNGATEVWNGPAAKKLHSWEVPWYGIPGNAETRLVALSPDGKGLAISTREKTGLVGGVVYDLDTGKEVTKLAAGPNATHWALKFSPDGKRLYRRYQVWDAETGKDITPGAGHRGRVTSVVVSGDGKIIVTTGDDLTARGWDAKTGKELWRADFPYPVWLRRLDADTALAVEGWGSKLIDRPLVTLSTGKLSPLPGDMAKETKGKAWHGETQRVPVTVTPDGKTAVVLNSESSALELWDWTTGKLRQTTAFAPPEKFRTDRMSTAVTVKGGKELLALFVYREEKPSQGSGPAFRGMVQLERWELTTGKRLEVTPFPQYAMPRLLSDGEKPLLADGFFVIKEALTAKEVFRLTDEQKKQYQSLAFRKVVLSPDGNTLAVPSDWSEVATVQFIDLKTGKDLGKRTFAEQPRSSVGYLPDGRLITIGESVLVWKK